MKEKLTHFRIGQIVNTQGLKGEVRVYPYVDDINRFDDLESFYLNKNFNEEFEVERVRYKGNMVIMKIKGIDSVELAEKLKTKNLYISRENSVDLDEDEFFIADLIGLEVFTVAGDKVGVLKDVLQYSANDVYVVKGSRMLSTPALKRLLHTVDIENKRIVFDADVLEEVGLFED